MGKYNSPVLSSFRVRSFEATLTFSREGYSSLRNPFNAVRNVITESDVAAGIQWSEYLDPLFVNNYESDPSLSWQYYGATSGFLRRFPGKCAHHPRYLRNNVEILSDRHLYY